jgi:hypothetical protein
MTDDSRRYPIGPFRAPETLEPPAIDAAIAAIAALPAELAAAAGTLPDARLDRPYRPGGWTVRQLVHHVADSHLNAYCRHRLAMTEERPTIKPYDQDAWSTLADARREPVASSLEILRGLHARWTALLGALEPLDFERLFFHPERPGAPWRLGESVLMYAWHGRHHTAQILAARRDD